MDTGTILRVVRDELRQKYGWSKNHCRVTEQGEPLQQSPEFFVGIIDGGIEGSPADGYYLEETYRLHVWVWRRITQHPKDRKANVLLDEEPHLGNVRLPSDLERQVKKFIHHNHRLRQAINDAFGAGTEEHGSGLSTPFIYQGSTTTQVLPVVDGVGGQVPTYAGRMLRFGGAMHIDPICDGDH